MPEVRNKSGVPHRYYDYAQKAYLVWAPWEVRDVSHTVAHQVCQAHPDKMELVLPTQEPAEAAVGVSDDFTEKAVDRAQRGGSRRSTGGE